MNPDVFSGISTILERDSKSTTYKFALLRGVIDIIQDNSPFIELRNGRAYMPLGLLVEKWILYYYPIFDSDNQLFIPQINGAGKKLRFQIRFEDFIQKYSKRGGFSAFYNDLRGKGLPSDFQADFEKLIHEIRDTVATMPMKHIGYSMTQQYYSIFHFEKGKRARLCASIDREYLIMNLGTFSIPIDYYEAFKILGSFINGKDSILVKWAEFSVSASGRQLSIHQVMDEVLKSPITEREIKASKRLYEDILKREGRVYCVWSGKKINSYAVDHMIPFSVWKNNDLWNLLPTQPSINSKKRDKIPSPDSIDRRQELILLYWKLMHKNQSTRFMKEIQMALLGHKKSDIEWGNLRSEEEEWQQTGIDQLKESCRYLINQRGFEEWKM